VFVKTNYFHLCRFKAVDTFEWFSRKHLKKIIQLKMAAGVRELVLECVDGEPNLCNLIGEFWPGSYYWTLSDHIRSPAIFLFKETPKTQKCSRERNFAVMLDNLYPVVKDVHTATQLSEILAVMLVQLTRLELVSLNSIISNPKGILQSTFNYLELISIKIVGFLVVCMFEGQ
jgi:hypothetical protein